ncbi:MAG: S41 family peptidase [Chitinophagales bacterium]|nr:S41 family peptidase [Chitinophagales bacterium]MDW8274478.1 S41 family peptidase [Chitinophagales bacterium]
MKKIRNLIAAVAGGGAALLLAIFLLSSSHNVSYFEINKNLDIFGTLYKELNTLYVDTLNHEMLIRAGIDSMLEQIDPYTSFIAEEDAEDYRLQTTGKYAGIGALISTRGEYVIISEPYEGFPAAKAGLRAGDKILEVDGKSVRNLKTDEVSRLLKGRPGSEVTVKIKRLGADGKESEMLFKLIREEIKIKNVSYYGFVAEGIGYIRLSNFTMRAGQEVRNALLALENGKKLKGLVLDVRSNPGGLLDEAINTASVFVDRNTEIVSVRGRLKEDTYTRRTANDPVDTRLPMVVLTDANSASAAEIVAGALQDLDRAVVVGQRTFGKGLVQTTKPLPYNTRIKITTAKYYIPSGRCIQAINYAERDSNGRVTKIPDSLRTPFKTRSGRIVYDGAGIEPDIKTEPDKVHQIAITLFTRNYFFDYATEFRAVNNNIPPAKNFSLSDAEYDKFVKWLSGKDYNYTTESEKILESFKAASRKENYFETIKNDLDSLQIRIMYDKKQDLVKQKEQIKMFLEEEIASRYYLNTGRIEVQCRYDNDLKTAVELLSDPERIKSILQKK